MTNNAQKTYDVVVIGGGAAGLGGALTLTRARRSVLVVDAGQPRNAPAAGVHGFLTRDGISPAELVALGRAEVRGYGGEFLDMSVASVQRDTSDPEQLEGFRVTLEDGSAVRGRRILVATGLVDQLPDIPGLRERWGHDVVHCPYCHGWEIRDQQIGVLATGPRSVHQAHLFRQWSADVTLFLNDQELTTQQRQELAARGIRIVEGRVAELEVHADRLTGVRLQDGTMVPIQALAVGAPVRSRSDVLAALGVEGAEHPTGAGEFVEAGLAGASAVPGVWLAGNVTDLMAQVVGAAAAGVMAGAAINSDLIAVEISGAVALHELAGSRPRPTSEPAAAGR